MPDLENLFLIINYTSYSFLRLLPKVGSLDLELSDLVAPPSILLSEASSKEASDFWAG